MIFRELKEIYPSDQTFEDEFARATETNSQKAVYILRALEREARRRKEQAKAAENEPGTLTLEHILPRNPGQEWALVLTADPSLKEDCTHRLGNMCLLVGGENKDIGRADFDKKKKVYEKTNILITKDLGIVPDWNRQGIDVRQSELAKIALSTWQFQ